MRVVYANTDYGAFLDDLYESNPGLEQASYKEQLHARNSSLFGVFDAYSRGFAEEGYEAIDLHINNIHLQRAWMREAGRVAEFDHHEWRMRRGFIPWPVKVARRDWMHTALLAQIDAFQPDVLICCDPVGVGPDLLRELRSHTKLLVAQIASPYPADFSFKGYDLVLSSMPHFVNTIGKSGVPARLSRLGFDPVVLEHCPMKERDIPVSFIGSLSRHHRERLEWLEEIARAVPLSLWTPSLEELPKNSPLRACHKGSVWGRDMFQILVRSRITLNRHINVAGRYANNMRLYEATGCGALLVTEDKDNIRDHFEPGREILTYRNGLESVEIIQHHLADEGARASIAKAGQARTLREHTYRARAGELGLLFREFLNRPRQTL